MDKDAVGLRAFEDILKTLTRTVLLVLDDTLANKRGLKVFGNSLHRNPRLSSRSKAVSTWSHNGTVFGF
ncbi:MAG: hypothetical protein ACFCD0_29890 [Gemmataceae bacterium]